MGRTRRSDGTRICFSRSISSDKNSRSGDTYTSTGYRHCCRKTRLQALAIGQASEDG